MKNTQPNQERTRWAQWTTPLLLSGMMALASCTQSATGSGPVDPGGPGDPPPLDPLTITVPEVTAGQNDAALTWSTSFETTANVSYSVGESASPVQIDVAPASLVHALTLNGLTASTVYTVQVSATDANGRTIDSELVQFTTLDEPVVTTEFVSDDFYANNLDPRWSFENPLGGAQIRMLAGATGEGALELSVPPGINSSPWMTLNGARVTQAVEDEDMGLQAIFTSPLENNATGKGIVFEQDADNWARFDFAYNAGKFQVFAAVFQNGALQDMQYTVLQNAPWTAGGTLGMRVTRTGTSYAQEYSLDGTNWIAGATMTSTLTLAHAGLFIAAEGSPAEGVVAVIDSIELLSAPLTNEDGQLAADTQAPRIFNANGTGLGPNSVELAWRTEESAQAEVRYGRTVDMEEGVQTFSGFAFSQSGLIGGLQADSLYYLEIKAIDATGHASTQVLQVQTQPDNQIGAPSIELWATATDTDGTPLARFGDLGLGQAQINVMGNVQDADEDRVAQTVTLEYRVGQGAWLPLTLGDDRTINYAPWRLANEGDFNLELMVADLATGTLVNGAYQHELMLRATDDENHQSFQSLRVALAAGNTWDPNYSVDWSQIMSQGGSVTDGAQIVDGKWNLENVAGLGDVLRTDPAHLGYDRLIAIGEGQGANAWENYEAELDATILALDPQGYTTGTASYGFGFVMRWQGHTAGGPYDQPNHNIYPLGAGFLYRWFDNNERWELWRGFDEGIESLPGSDLIVGTRYSMKLRCETQAGGGSRYRMKVWEFGSTEPAAWTFDRTTDVSDTITKGSLLLVAHHADVAFGNIQVTELP